MDFTEINSRGKRGELLGRIDRQNSHFRTTRTITIKFGLYVSFVELESAKNALNGVIGRIDDKNSIFALIDLDLKLARMFILWSRDPLKVALAEIHLIIGLCYKLEPVPLMGRSAILGDQRNNYFCDVACGRGESADSTFAVTKSGLLCEFNGRRLLDKWVELRISVAYSITVGENLILIGCSDGIVRCFSPIDLHFICTLPRPHYLGVDVAKGLTGR
ncbi:mitogen-activated protein kinase-binding protein 1 [Trichonephila clavipes]|nr:mitogen-activated protein kinase-binding protein 1 [Trichonephila clavipes]